MILSSPHPLSPSFAPLLQKASSVSGSLRAARGRNARIQASGAPGGPAIPLSRGPGSDIYFHGGGTGGDMSFDGDHLDRLESESITILREAFAAVDRLGMLWSMGKDSNAGIRLARKAFFGRVPFPVIHVDTGLEFPEVYAFRDRMAREWGL